MICVARQATAEGGAGSTSKASGCDPVAGCRVPESAVFKGAFAVASPKAVPLLCATAPSWASEGKQSQGLVLLPFFKDASGLCKLELR